ncbi:DNA methylase family protein [Leptospira interrogans str. 2003000735]|uniref:Methyltransferase n=2 Tax=Leptospira interrogans TaxID=173 RepID=A0A829D1Z9_LEPIR|nr:site-specific DNA-methyltransferase [Leptospira interrogans]EMY06292.1 DNA methylase family protein [Leptospira interrogans str. 2002000626]EMY25572.1 DNA methylase family protein [Leptospira interrogans serovar Australis str. 200703203]EKN89894.1 DNA methylase family protein [Leptospira interrogans str. 2002000624]EKQ40307.1 DNA methylase family protein [Leptospira interrogans str. 2002000621]EKQ46094.1 DNA methylase family protein [Leptospira interrogans str. 2002000623]
MTHSANTNQKTEPSIQLFNDDCFKIFPSIPDQSVNLVLCDLPYGTTGCSWDVILPFRELWEQYNRLIVENGAVILTASQPFTTALINSNPKNFRYELIWYKTKASGFLNANKMPNKSHENILIFYKKLPVYNSQKYEIDSKFLRKGKSSKKNSSNIFKIRGPKSETYQYLDRGLRHPDSVLCFPSESGKGIHPTQKPTALMNFLIRSYSNKGDTILDNCMGSGTTGVACVQTDRNFIGVEKELEYFELAKRRIETAKKIRKLKLLSSIFSEKENKDE